MLSFKNIPKINICDKSIVYGYIRRIQTLIESKLIPLVINYICLLYFYESDEFGYGRKKICFTEDEGKTRYVSVKVPRVDLLNGDNANCTCYGMMDIAHNEYSSKFLYQWRFEYSDKYAMEIIHIPDIIIGITDSPNVQWYDSNNGHHIGLSNCGEIYTTVYMPSQTCKDEHYLNSKEKKTHKRYLPGSCYYIFPHDELIVNIDITAKQMEYVIKRYDTNRLIPLPNKYPILFENTDHKYRMVAHYCGTGISVKLIEFKKICRTLPRRDEHESILNQIQRIEHDESLKKNGSF